jgi:hypothetical protein
MDLSDISTFVTNNPAGVMSFLGGGVIAWGVGLIWTHWIMRPVVSVRLDEKRGCYGPTQVFVTHEDGRQTYSYDVRFLRLLVENTGLSSIKDCCGYITKLTKRTDKGDVVPKQEIISLGWAHHAHSSARSIPRGAFFHMDVVTLHLLPTGRVLRPPVLPTSLMDFFAEKGTYEFEILIVADNVSRRKIAVEFAFDPQRDELTFKARNWARYPWWAWWRWLRSWIG